MAGILNAHRPVEYMDANANIMDGRRHAHGYGAVSARGEAVLLSDIRGPFYFHSYRGRDFIRGSSATSSRIVRSRADG